MSKRITAIAWAVASCLAAARALAMGTAGSSPLFADGPGRMTLLVLQAGVLLMAAHGGSLLFERLRLPPFVGALLAGALIGPYSLGSRPLPGLPGGMFPPESAVSGGAWLPGLGAAPELAALFAVVSAVFAFDLGLDTELRAALKRGECPIALGAAAACALVGCLAAALLCGPMLGVPGGFGSPVCALLGVLPVAASLRLTSRALAEERRTETPSAVVLLGAARLADLAAVVLLCAAFAVSSARSAAGPSGWTAAWRSAGAVGLWLAATILLLLAARGGRQSPSPRAAPSALAPALGVGLAIAAVFAGARLPLFAGAYAIGIGLSGSRFNRSSRDATRAVRGLLSPLPFAAVGMLVDPRLAFRPGVAGFAVLCAALAVGSKVIGAGLPALAAGFSRRGALRLGVGMSPGGDLALLGAGAAAFAGILPPAPFAAAVLTATACALAARPLTCLSFRCAGPCRRGHGATDDREQLLFSFPSPRVADLVAGDLRILLEEEGFVALGLGIGPHDCQLRRGDLIIGLRQHDADVILDCRPDEYAFVRAVVAEMVRQSERTLNELREPVDQAPAARAALASATGEERARSLAPYVSEDVLVPRLRAGSKPEVIDELLGVLSARGMLQNPEPAREAVAAREATMSTGLQFGIAVPHARTAAVDRIVCAVGLKPEGVDFAAIDGRPSRIFVLTLAPLAAAAAHGQFLALIGRALNERTRDALLRCATAAEMHQVLVGGADAVDRFLAGKKAAEGPGPAHAGAREAAWSLYLRPQCVRVPLRGRTKADVIDELLETLAHQHLLADAGAAREAVMERESRMPTGLEQGVAIPHARTNAVDRLVCALGVHRTGVDFGAADGIPARIIVLSISPAQTSAPHVQFMAMMARFFDEEGRRRVLEAAGPDDLYRVLLRGKGA